MLVENGLKLIFWLLFICQKSVGWWAEPVLNYNSGVEERNSKQKAK